MSNNREAALMQALKSIEKQYGKGSVMKLGEKTDTRIEVVSSGSLALDSALGVGGYPRGRVVEIYGPESSGKTTFALHAIAEVQKAGGTAAKSLAVTLYAILTDNKKIKGKTNLDNLLKSNKELKVFAIHHSDLKKFCEEAKHYGVLYSVLKEKNNTDGIVDIMVKAEDASKISSDQRSD